MLKGLPHQLRQIGWNGIRLKVQWSWEVIVMGSTHLLIEQDFQPVLEMRWQQHYRRNNSDVLGAIITKFTKDTGISVEQVSLPSLTSSFTRENMVALANSGQTAVSGLLWQCDSCGSVVLCHFPPGSSLTISDLQPVIDSVRCHDSATERSLWSIQDFSLRLPPNWQFTDHTIAAGLTRLAFHDRATNLHVCRLAPAGERLKGNSLPGLLSTLQENLYADEPSESGPGVFECWNEPSLGNQIRQRLRRKKPFGWGKIWHIEEYNRLLAMTIDSNQPIDRQAAQLLSQEYEIISQP